MAPDNIPSDSFHFALMNASDVQNEIKAVAGLIESRRATFLDASIDSEQAKEKALITNLAKKIQCSLSCSIVDGQKIYDEFKDCMQPSR